MNRFCSLLTRANAQEVSESNVSYFDTHCMVGGCLLNLVAGVALCRWQHCMRDAFW